LVHENIRQLSKERPYFDLRAIKDIEAKYVCWLDIMGFANFLSISSNKAAIFVGKLHEAILRSKDKTGFSGYIYPIIDGCYVTCDNKRELFSLLKSIYRMLSLQFILEKQYDHKFLVRSCVAFGEVVEGHDLISASNKFSESDFNREYISKVLFGVPLWLANSGEKLASPYGVWIDNSARQFAPFGHSPIRMASWKWWRHRTDISDVDDYCDQIIEDLSAGVIKYFEWCLDNFHSLNYPKDKILHHKTIAQQYFLNL